MRACCGASDGPTLSHQFGQPTRHSARADRPADAEQSEKCLLECQRFSTSHPGDRTPFTAQATRFNRATRPGSLLDPDWSFWPGHRSPVGLFGIHSNERRRSDPPPARASQGRGGAVELRDSLLALRAISVSFDLGKNLFGRRVALVQFLDALPDGLGFFWLSLVSKLPGTLERPVDGVPATFRRGAGFQVGQPLLG